MTTFFLDFFFGFISFGLLKSILLQIATSNCHNRE